MSVINLKHLLVRMDGLRDRLDTLTNLILQPEGIMSQFDTLRDEIKRNRAVTASAVELLNGLSARLSAVQSPEDLTEFINELQADTQELAAAVAANTPAAPVDPNPTVAEPNPNTGVVEPNAPVPETPQPVDASGNPVPVPSGPFDPNEPQP